MAKDSLAFLSVNDRDVPVVSLLNDLFYQAAEDGWSDLHFETQADQTMRIRARIRGSLAELETISAQEALLLITKLRYRANLAIDDIRNFQDGRFTQEINGRRVEVRLSIAPTVHGVSAVCRLLDSKNAGLPIDKLGMPPEVEKLYRWALQQREGGILSGGPTGSGKTTTLYAGIAEIYTPQRKFITAEDPVEYILEGIDQIPVGAGTGRTFATAIRSMLRQDPDDILIGEIRDEETAQMAMRAAMTGHKVLASIHANSAIGVHFRLSDLGVPTHLMKSALKVAFAQRIVMTVCPHCREQKPVQFPEVFEKTGVPCPDTEWMGRGCEQCQGTPGYSGRRVIFEAIRYDKKYRDALGDGRSKTADEEAMLIAASEQPQYAPLRTWGARYILEGITNSQAIYWALSDVEDF